jgi:hypothetical protein
VNKLPKLPTGIQSFEKIREKGYLYVDKTKYLVDLIDDGEVYFLSRPRRFGKSLTISTFDALFSGKKELFRGLYAEKFFERPDYKAHPVVELDMSKVIATRGMETLVDSMILQVRRNAERHSVGLSELAFRDPSTALCELIETLAKKEQIPVVVLVDEYDHPILDFIAQPEKADEIRRLLKDFYTQIKASDKFLRFVFMTGISKSAKMGIFSAMNNLKDISMKNEYATMLGYTEDELLSNFGGHIDRTAAALGESREDLVSQIRDYYDGFSFDGRNRLYNPFSTLNFFDDATFKNYWFETGTPSFLVAYVKKHDLEVENFRGLSVDDEFTLVAEIERASPESFLFQSGYLAVREQRGRNLVLDYPNKEVLSSVARLFLYGKFELPGIRATANDLGEALGNGCAGELVKVYNALLASLPYDLYEREERKYAREHRRKQEGGISVPYAESFYHMILFALIWASQVNTTAENHSYRGRSDIEAEKNGHRYVVELKVADGKEAAEKAADDAMMQIREKGYADKYAETGVTQGSTTRGSTTLIGLAVDRTARRVGACRIEKDRRVTLRI